MKVFTLIAVFVEKREMQTNKNYSQPNYWFSFIPFSIAAGLGFASLILAELFMPNNAGGMEGKLAMYRSLGTLSVCWLAFAIWSWGKIRESRTSTHHTSL
tara:strand:+ start:553 stop:852 length:300 start_codon:yes stop_codon:yes gene_type:complete